MERLIEDAELGCLVRLTGDARLNQSERLSIAKLVTMYAHRQVEPPEPIEPSSVKAKASKPKQK